MYRRGKPSPKPPRRKREKREEARGGRAPPPPPPPPPPNTRARAPKWGARRGRKLAPGDAPLWTATSARGWVLASGETRATAVSGVPASAVAWQEGPPSAAARAHTPARTRLCGVVVVARARRGGQAAAASPRGPLRPRAAAPSARVGARREGGGRGGAGRVRAGAGRRGRAILGGVCARRLLALLMEGASQGKSQRAIDSLAYHNSLSALRRRARPRLWGGLGGEGGAPRPGAASPGNETARR